MPEISDSKSADKPAKRTRICGPQSKNGCFTCKRRRLKCDETKPTCQRCSRSTVECEGYPNRTSRRPPECFPAGPFGAGPLQISDETKSLIAPVLSLSLLDRCSRSQTQDRLARVGLNLLSHGLSDQFDFTITIFNELLPQLSHALSSVNAAAAALGAIYELQAADPYDAILPNSVAAEQYGIAIRGMQQDLQKQPFGPIPLLMTCMLLACSELLLRRRSYALMHIQAGFNILEGRRKTLPASVDSLAVSQSPRDSSDSSSDSAPVSAEDELFILFRTFDIHGSSYADRRTPTMPTQSLQTPSLLLLNSSDPQIIGLDLIAVIHACLHFTSAAGRYKYVPTEMVPAELLIEQGRHLGILAAWLKRLHQYEPSGSGRTHLLMLRNMCLSTIVFASTILLPRETDWDDYSWHFEQIVISAEEILNEREIEAHGNESYDAAGREFAFQFTPLPGVIQPLFLTAFKYRNPTWRRRAAQCMRKAGREGPWIGTLAAAVADRIADIEEAGSGFDTFIFSRENGEEYLDSADIPGSQRISGVGMDANNNRGRNIPVSKYFGIWTARRPGVTRARFFRCKDVEGMLKAEREQSHNACEEEEALRRAQSLIYGEQSNQNQALYEGSSPNEGVSSWKNDRYWEVWDELVDFEETRRKNN